jgi:hypothetical protein
VKCPFVVPVFGCEAMPDRLLGSLGAGASVAVIGSAVEYTRTRPQLDPVFFVRTRRIEDLAYGAGVWWGAIKGRSAAARPPDSAGRPKGTGR